MEPENNSQKQAMRNGGRFKQGHSGNPSGRPRGTLNKANRLVLDLIAANAEEIVEKIKYRALVKGDMVALKALLDRISPPRRDPPISFDLPPLGSMTDLVRAQTRIVEKVATGDLTPTEGKEICGMINHIATTTRLDEIAKRLEAIELGQGRGDAV